MSPRPSFDPGFSTEALTELYSPESVVAAFLRFEEALALALADAGLAPQDEADAVAAACRSGVADPESVLASTWDEGTPVMALRESVTSGLAEGSARWFHFGATTQDTIDTAQMIQARAALALLEDQLVVIARRLRDLTVEYRDQPQMGRTFLQDARPTTFGFRTATWLNAVVGHIGDVRRIGDELSFQLGGSVGTLSIYGDSAADLLVAVGKRLGLAPPDISWHTDRSQVIELAQTVQRIAATMAKIGSDVALLASSTIAEIRVRSGGSSSMPEKRNP
ncbi:MAG TPA: lyase family protein, partial [Acidimicrobiia bacterium]|nr:lyase family protein [Acidimicrobiia bacterium]